MESRGSIPSNLEQIPRDTSCDLQLSVCTMVAMTELSLPLGSVYLLSYILQPYYLCQAQYPAFYI